jgi:hypothetical protein
MPMLGGAYERIHKSREILIRRHHGRECQDEGERQKPDHE